MGKAFAIFALVCLLLGSVASVTRAGVAPGTPIPNQAGASYSSITGSTTTSVSNVVQVITTAGSTQASLTLTKTVSAATANPGSSLTYSLTAANMGTGDASTVMVAIDGTNVNKIVVRDVIPDNTEFASFVAWGGLTPLYHLFGTAPSNYVSAAPSDLTTVDAVAFAMDTLAAGTTASFKFSVTLNSNASGTISNTGVVYFNNGNDTSTPSNTVIVSANGPGPGIGFFTNGGFSKPAPVGTAGQPLYIQANAAACNANPVAVDTVQIAVSALLSGDVETFTATETGPNTGIFQVTPPPPTRDASSNPVIPGNGIMEVLSGDTVTAVLKGCGASSVSATLSISPSSVVFEGHSNQLVANAKVTLLDVTGQGNGGNPGQPAVVFMADGVTPAPSTVTTASNGRFQFLYVLPSTYKFVVNSPGFNYPSTVTIGQLPAGHTVDSNASYGKNFAISAPGPVRFDQPMDLATTGLLLIEKLVAESTAQIGDYLDYTIQVKNTSVIALANVQVNDTLPRGFAYQAGTTRDNGAVAPDPSGAKSPSLVFTIPSIPANSEVDITYRVHVGATVVMGANTNFATANAGTTKSNPTSATVQLLGGAFSSEGYIVGKVFADCNGNGKQDLDEPGIPGVRVLLEDLTSAVTDIKGKYSLYGVSPLTHVVKIDPLTLPAGYEGEIMNHRNAGDPNSMFVDMKNGQMFRADFATSCSPKLASEIATRTKKQGKGFVEAEAGLNANFTYDTIRRGEVEAKAAPSAGIIGHAPVADQNSTGATPAGTTASASSSPAGPALGPVAAPSVPANSQSTTSLAQPEKTQPENQPASTVTEIERQPSEPSGTLLPGPVEKTVDPALNSSEACVSVPLQTATLHNAGSADQASVTPPFTFASVFFPTGYPTPANAKIGLLPSQQETLSELADNIKSYAQYDSTAKLIVVGHADSRGSQEYNLGLSERRANLTRDVFILLGNGEKKIETRAESRTKPLRGEEVANLLSSSPDKAPDFMIRQFAATTLAYNRRVDITLEPVGKQSDRTFHYSTSDARLLWQMSTPSAKAIIEANSRFVSSTAGAMQSNTASAASSVFGSAFSNVGFVFPKAFTDCDGNGKQSLDRPGISGADMILEDHTSAMVERQAATSARSIGYIPAVQLISARTFLTETAGSSKRFATSFNAMPSAPVDSESAKVPAVSEPTVASASPEPTKAPEVSESAVAIASPEPAAAPAQPEKPKSESQPASTPSTAGEQPAEPLETLLPQLDSTLGFINVTDNQVMPYTQTPVRVKGPSGTTFKLFVNDVEVSEKSVGKKVVDFQNQVEAWEFIGVELKPGHNALRVAQFDPWGNQRGAALITLIAPKPLRKIRIGVPKQAEADGKTPVRVAVHLFDADDIPVMVPTELTLETTDGEWKVEDIDARQPGTQVYVQGGEAFLPLMPPSDAGTAKIRISSGSVQSEAQLPFVPALRPMIASGVVDEILSLHNFSGNSISPVQTNDGFEEELRALSISNASGTTQLESHVGLSLKGKVQGSYLLTLAYDSDKANERLFRDIQPDEFYPVYGDSSVRSYDAQSTSRAYLRVDHGQSYVLYGDFATTENDSTHVLTVYNRSLTGVREHYQNDRVNVTAFASHDTYAQHVQEIPANGTSGPYMLANATGVINGETIDILVRDRNQPAVILKITPATRFVDYELEPYSGEILFTSPVPSLDQNLNPISIRVTYEMDQGGERFWVSGVDGTIKLENWIRMGGTFVADLNPGDHFIMKGINTSIKLDPHTTLNAEFATTHQDTVGDGDGYHFELVHDSENLKARAYFGRTTAEFDNINSLLNQGRGEGGLKLSWKFNSTTRLLADVIRTEDTVAGGTQEGGLVSVEHTLKNKMQLVFGVRHVDQGSLAASPSTAGSTNTTTTSILTKLTVPIPHVQRLQAYGEYEQDVLQLDKKIAAVGANFQMFERAKIYARRELISSLGNEFSLNNSQQQQATVIGIDSSSVKDTHIFSEYRDRDDFSGRETEAAIGLRRTWAVMPGLKFNGGIESVKVLKGSNATNNLALTYGADFAPSNNLKGTSRFEWRTSANTRGYLSTFGAAYKISQNWTFLGRNVLSTENSTSGPQSDQTQERAQMGFAFRDSATSSWNWLGMTEFRSERNLNPTAPTAQQFVVFSSNVNYEPTRKISLASRYAAKVTTDKSIGISNSSGDQLASLRLTYDLAKHWDLGFLTSIMFSNGFSSQQYSAGPELGRMLAKNLWGSVGYNVVGYVESDLSGENQMNRGPYLRLRFKFDEGLVEKIPGFKSE